MAKDPTLTQDTDLVPRRVKPVVAETDPVPAREFVPNDSFTEKPNWFVGIDATKASIQAQANALNALTNPNAPDYAGGSVVKDAGKGFKEGYQMGGVIPALGNAALEAVQSEKVVAAVGEVDHAISGFFKSLDWVQTAAGDALRQIYFTGTEGSFEEGRKKAVEIKEAREKSEKSGTIPPLYRPFAQISNAIDWAASGAKEVPNTVGGEITKGIAHVVPDILVASFAPEIKAAQWYSKFGMAEYSKFGMTLAVKGTIQSAQNEQEGTTIRKVTVPVLSAAEQYGTGVVFDLMGEAASKIGSKMADKLIPEIKSTNDVTSKKLVHALGTTTANSIMFGGYGTMSEFLTTGRTSWKSAATQAGMGIAMGGREIAKTLYVKGLETFISADQETLIKMYKDPIGSAEWANKLRVDTKRIEQNKSKNPEGEATGALLTGKAATLKSFLEQVKEDAPGVIASIQESSMPAEAKQELIDKINKLQVDTDEAVQQSKKYTDEIAKIDEEIAQIKENKHMPTLNQELKISSLAAKREGLVTKVVNLHNEYQNKRTPAQEKADAEALAKNTEQARIMEVNAQQVYQDINSELDKYTTAGGRVVSRLKTVPSMVGSATRKGVEVNNLTDIVGGAIILPDFTGVKQVQQQLKKDGWQLSNKRSPRGEEGWMGMTALKTIDGVPVEVQIHSEASWKAHQEALKITNKLRDKNAGREEEPENLPIPRVVAPKANFLTGFTPTVNIRPSGRHRIEVRSDESGEIVSSMAFNKKKIDGEDYWSLGSTQTNEAFKNKGFAQNSFREMMNNLPEDVQGIYIKAETIHNKTEIPHIIDKLGKDYDVEYAENGDIYIRPYRGYSAENQIIEHNKSGGSIFSQSGANLAGVKGRASVSIFPDRSVTIDGPLTPEVLNQFRKANADILESGSQFAIGTWHDAEGNVVVGVTKPVDNTNKSASTQEFFSDVATGTSEKFKPHTSWTPLEKAFTSAQEKFRKVFDRFKGNFDEHIATSIPFFRETQIKVGSAISEMYSDGGLVYDIGGSEGGFVKGITEVSEGKIKSVNLDPNPDMQKLHEGTPVKGSRFIPEAFYEGFDNFKAHKPKKKADVVHESMGFQFMGPNRRAHIDEVAKNYLKEDGIFITEEKVMPPSNEEYAANEAKKDQYKARSYTPEQIEIKRKEVLEGKDEAIEGMRANQTEEKELLKALSDNFKYVSQYWDSGNFKGYVASNNKAKIDEFMSKVDANNHEFSTRDNTQIVKIENGRYTQAPANLKTPKTVIDIVTTPKRERAVELGKKYGQEAVYDLETGELIDTEGTGSAESVRNIPIEERIKEASMSPRDIAMRKAQELYQEGYKGLEDVNLEGSPAKDPMDRKIQALNLPPSVQKELHNAWQEAKKRIVSGMKDKNRDMKQEFKDFVKEMPLAGLGVPLKKAMLNAVNRIDFTKPKSLEKAIDYFDKVIGDATFKYEAVATQKALDQIEKRVSDTYLMKKNDRGLWVNKVGPTGLPLFDELKAIRKDMIEGDWNEGQANIQKILEKYAEEDAPYMSEEDYNAIVRENFKGQLNLTSGANRVQIEGALRDLKSIIKTGKSEAAARRMNEQQTMKDFNDEVFKILTANGNKPVKTDQIDKASVKEKPYSRMWTWFKTSNWRSLMDILSKWDSDKYMGKGKGTDPDKSKLSVTMNGAVEDAHLNEAAAKDRARVEIQTNYSRIMGKKPSELRKMEKENSTVRHPITYTNQFGETRTTSMTRNEALKVWMELQDPTLRKSNMAPTTERDPKTGREVYNHDGYLKEEKVMEEREKLDEDGEETGEYEMVDTGERTYELTDFGQKVVDLVTPEMKEWARWQMEEFYPKYWARVNEVYRRKYGVDMPFNPNYSPIFVGAKFMESGANEDLILARQNALNTAANASLIARVNHGHKLALMDANKVLINYVDKMEHFINWTDALDLMNNTFVRNKDVRDAVRQNFGEDALRTIEATIDDFARRPQDRRYAAKWLNTFKNNFTIASLALKPHIFATQMTSLPAYVEKIGAVNWAKNNVLSDIEGTKRALNEIKNSEYWKMRYGESGGWDWTVIDAMMQDYSQLVGRGKWNNIKNQSMFITKWGDMSSLFLGGIPVYKYNYNKVMQETGSEELAKTVAMREFMDITNRSQQAGQVYDLSQVQRDPILRIATMYQTAPMQYHRNVTAALRNGILPGSSTRGGAWNNVKSALLYHVVLPSFYQWVANGFEFDKKDQLRAALIGNLNGVFVAGQVMESLMDRLRGMPWEYTFTPLESTVGKLIKGSLHVKDFVAKELDKELEDISYEDLGKAAYDIAKVLGDVTGTPVDAALTAGEAAKDVAEGNAQKPFRRILGWKARVLEDNTEEPDIPKVIESDKIPKRHKK